MVRIGIVSDIHMREADQDAVTKQLEQVVDRFNTAFQPDIVVVPGDLIEDGETPAADRQHITAVQHVLEQVDAPIRYLAGNHDVEQVSPDTLHDLFGHDLYGVETVDGQPLVFLDSSAPHQPGARGEISNDQLAFLDNTLQQHDDVVLFIHHPIHYRNLEDSYWWDTYPERALCGNKKEINDIIARHDSVRLMVNGHIHDNNHTVYNEIDHITVNAFNKETRESGVTGTYAELTATGSAITIDVREQDAVTTSVTIDR
jgi:3',5'-cyclic AMP phosphodiesterase CpdA